MLPILWLALWLAGFQARPAPVRATIQGVVVRAGAAAAGARAELGDARVELRPGNLATTTGATGSFTFRNLAPGRYTISVTRDGYIPQEGGQRGLTPRGLSVTVAAGQTLKDIVLPMSPAPVIIGKVIDPHGAPLAGALVRAYVRQYTPLGTKLGVAKKAMTNDMGEFRLFGLNFGDYFVSAGYGDRDRAAALGRAQLSANVSRADDGYATVFYDGAEDLSRAQAARVAPGSDPGAVNIYLRDTARFKIRGQVSPLIAGTKIVLAPRGSDLNAPDYFTQPSAGGAFEIRGVSPGSYVVLATAADDTFSSEVLPIIVTDRDVDGVRLTLHETRPISGRIASDGSTTSRPDGVLVKLVRSSVEFDQTVEARPARDGSFILEHVSPFAEYDVVLDSLPTGTYVKSISSGGRSVLPGKSRLDPLQAMVIVVAAATDGLDVHVTQGADAAAGVQVVLIPDPSLSRRADRYITDFTDASGDLHFSGVPPGGYTAYAFERIERDAYYVLGYNSSTNDRFRDRAVAVTIGANGTKSIQLRVIPAAETAAGLR
jgi:hypothetical protein